MAAVSLRARAIGLLARREHTRTELQQKLIAKGGAPSAVGQLLDDLVAQGYLSDARYARATVAAKGGAFGRRRIAATLKAKGVARADIQSALSEAGLDEEAALRSLWQRRFGGPPVDERDRARQIRFLQARGFAVSAILRVLREAAENAPD